MRQSATNRVVLLSLLLLLLGFLCCVNGGTVLQLRTAENEVLLPTKCPCEHPEWCAPITRQVKNEVFIFVLSADNWMKYDWTRVTTAVKFGQINDSLTCYAHSQGARSVYGANFPVGNLTNKSDRARWVAEQVKFTRDHFLDGINVDFESEIDKNDSASRDGLTALMKELTSAFKSTFTNTQVTYDVGWSPDCIDKRCYDYAAIASIVDFVFVMSYDERSQIFYDCVAYANSALNTTIHGVERYLAMRVNPRKIVLGIPWYGYSYPCLSLDKDNTCHIKKVPFRGVECSDAAGSQNNYAGIINDLLPASTSGLMWDVSSQSPFFNWKDPKSGMMHQIWYDNPQSLTLKYKYAVSRGLLGVGMWQADAIDYSDTPAGQKQRTQMWGAIPYTK